MATIRTLLRDHVSLQLRSVDRIFVAAYVPRLMTAGMVIRFLLDRGFRIPSPALFGRIGRRYVAEIEQFAAENGIPIVRFGRRERKHEIASPYLEQAARRAASASS